jgi:hypothetical protein
MNTKPEKEYVADIEEQEEMTWEEIETAVRAELDEAIKFQKEVIVPQRSDNWDRYYGRPLGNEVAGRSQYMSRDLLETVEWVLPNLIALFTSMDHKIKVKIFNDTSRELGITAKQIGEALMDQIYKDLYTDEEAGLFTVFYTWFKDALVSGSAYVKLFWEEDYTLEEFSEILDAEGLDELSARPEITIAQTRLHPPTGQIEVQGTYERISKDMLVCSNTPHWEFVFEEQTKHMNDEFGKGITTIVTLDYLRRINKAFSDDEDSYFYNLDLVETVASQADSYYRNDSEMKKYYEYEILNDYAGAKQEGPKRRVQLSEWITRLDVNGDGFLEDIKVYIANGVMIRWELNEVNFVPHSKLSPIIDCYNFQGIAYADLIVELQNLKTALMRKMLDNFDLNNAGRWFMKPNTPIDLERFLQNVPGDVFSIDPDKIKNVAPSGFDASNLSLLEYIESIKENRTGSTRYNQGTDANTLNQTAHGLQTIMNASLKRIELIGRLFAEGGLKDFFKKAVLLYQKNLKEPFTAVINGEEMQITPEMIQGRIEVIADMGAEAQVGQAESQKLLQMSAVLVDLNSKYPGIVSPDKMRNVAVKYVQALGYEATSYISSAKEFAEAQQQQQEMQQQIQEMQMQMERLKVELEREGVNIDKIKVLGEIAAAQEELKAKLFIEAQKLKQKGVESSTRQKIDLFGRIYQQTAQARNSNVPSLEAPKQQTSSVS